ERFMQKMYTKKGRQQNLSKNLRSKLMAAISIRMAEDQTFILNFRKNLVSTSGIDFTVILPPCELMICFDRLNPMPEPSCRVEKKGTKICASTLSGMP